MNKLRRASTTLLGAIAITTSSLTPYSTRAQEELPPIPIPATPVESAPPPVLPASPSAPTPANQLPPRVEPGLGTPEPGGIDATVEFGSNRTNEDLRQVVNLFINESFRAGQQADAVNYPFLEDELNRQQAQSPLPNQQVEQDFIRNLLARYGEPGDRLLGPNEFDILLNRPRSPIQSRQIAAGVAYSSVAELTPATASQLGQSLFVLDYSNGVVLDLRGSVGYDPQVVADIARLFLPRTITPLIITSDRFGQTQEWDGNTQPIAANLPLVVLVDGQTRKGATLLAAILALSSRTAVVGQPTQGSRLQSSFYVLPSGGAVELAVAEWNVAPFGDGPPISAEQGVVPAHALFPGSDWVASAPQYLPPEATPSTPNIFLEEGTIGRFSLGFDIGNPDASRLGFIDTLPRNTGENVFRPDSDLKLYHIEDYVIFGYRNRETLRSHFADRIYMTAPDAYTAEGIGIGDTYAEVISIYGPPGEGGYNEINPFPLSSRTTTRAELYFINYDALGISFGFESGTNQVRAIGLYKAGS